MNKIYGYHTYNKTYRVEHSEILPNELNIHNSQRIQKQR